MNQPPTYGLWTLVILNSVVFIAFALSFFKPRTLLMFPVLVLMYARLARGGEHAAVQEFGASYTDYAAGAHAFPPRLSCQAR
jgi:protein-S-isoprenylcysteine O-methyltransferase Ste14